MWCWWAAARKALSDLWPPGGVRGASYGSFGPEYAYENYTVASTGGGSAAAAATTKDLVEDGHRGQGAGADAADGA